MTSVIINTINENPEVLARAIKSYVYQDVEIIISTIKNDPSTEWNKEYKVIVSEKGIYKQLNNAIKKIKGEYFCYASGNDIALPKKIRIETDILKFTGKKVCYSAFYRVNGGKKTALFHDYDIEKHLAGNFVSDCSMIETKLLKKYLPFNENWENDAHYDFWLRLYEGEGNIFVYNSEPTWTYFVNKNSSHIIRRTDPIAWDRRNEVRKRLINYHKGLLKYV